MTEDIRKGKNNFDEAHKINDLDFGPNSFHHTLGNGPLQAAPGKHTHKALPVSTGVITVPTPGAFAEGVLLAPAVWPNDQATGISWVVPGTTPKAQAGIYVQQSGAYGTRMHFATTNNFTTGQQTGMTLDELGKLAVLRAGASFAGTVTSTVDFQPSGWFRSLVSGYGWYNNADAQGIHPYLSGVATYPNGTNPFRCSMLESKFGDGSWIHSLNTTVAGDPAWMSSRDVSLIFSSNSQLYANDNARTVWRSMAAASFVVSSSKYVKANIVPTRFEGIKTLMKFNVKDYLRTEMTETPDKVETGLIAEDVTEIYPQVVSKDENDAPMGIDYGQLSPIIIQALQELVKESRETIKDLKARIVALEAKVA